MNIRILFFGVVCSLFAAGWNARADDWMHWRGNQRNGHSQEVSGFKNGKWNLKQRWKIATGIGSSSPIVVGDLFYDFSFQTNEEVLSCHRIATGEVIWSQKYRTRKYGRKATGDQGLFSGPCSTPEYDLKTGYLYTLGSDGILSCWNSRENGKLVWQKQLHDSYQIPQRPRVGRSGLRDYGFTSSPLLYKNQLIVEVGATEGTLISFDKLSGKPIWASKANSPAGHNGGPVQMNIEGVPCVAVHNHDGLLVVRMDESNQGKTVATVDWVTSFSNNIATVAVRGNQIVLSSGYNQNRTALFEVSLKGGARKIWENKYPSKICSPVIQGDHLYLAWRTIKCIDMKSGRLKWEGGKTSDAGSIVLTKDQKLIVWSNRGTLTLVESANGSNGKYKPLFQSKVLSRADAWPHVVLANRQLLCKDRLGTLVCFEIQP